MSEPELSDLLERADVKRLRELLDGRDDAVLWLASEDGIMRWGSTGGSAAMFGRDPSEYVGDSVFDYIDPRDHETVVGGLMGAARAGDSRTMVYRARAADGSWVEVRTVAWLADGADGDPIVVAISVPAQHPPVMPPP